MKQSSGKRIKKLITFVLAAMMTVPAGFTAFAVDNGGSTKVTYNIQPSYVVTIPDGVSLSKTAETTATPIKAEKLNLERGKEVTVVLTSASNTQSGSLFSAVNSDGNSIASYRIKSDGKEIAVGEKVASFRKNGEKQLTFSKAEGALCAGVHTESLIFTILLENITPVDLTGFSGEYKARDSDIITGTANADAHITVEDGAIITLKNYKKNEGLSNDSTNNFEALTLNGSATIFIEGENTVKGCNSDCSAIFVPKNSTLTIKGNGRLNAFANGDATAIGGEKGRDSGNIEIDLDDDGELTANGGNYSAAIGAAADAACGNISIKNGKVNAFSAENGSGIGSAGLMGDLGLSSVCGDITILGGTVHAKGDKFSSGIGSSNGELQRKSICGKISICGGTVIAEGGLYGAGIGCGDSNSICGDIILSGGTVSANGGRYSVGIGCGSNDSICGEIKINGGTVRATGGEYSLGIGNKAVSDSYCGNIIIENTVTELTAIKGNYYQYTIKAKGSDEDNAKLIIGGTEYSYIENSPYTYKPVI